MSMILAVALLSAVVILYRALLLGARLAKKPWWARDHWVGYVFGPCLMAMLALGLGLLISGVARWSDLEFDLVQAGALIAIVVVCVSAWRGLNRSGLAIPGKPALESAGAVIEPTPAVDGAPADASPPPPPSPPKAA